MIDIHAHILHGLDDGPYCLEDSLALLTHASMQGITDIIATPHYHLPHFDNLHTMERLIELQKAAVSNNIAVNIHLGNEVYADEMIVTQLKNGLIHTLAQSSYILLELPVVKLYPVHHDLIFKLQREGFKVILAHIERYRYFKDSPETLVNLINKGCYGQISAEYVVKNQKSAKRLIECGLVHVVASDMHSVDKRPSYLAQAHSMIQKSLPQKVSNKLLSDNPKAIINDLPMERIIAKEPRKSWFEALIN